MQIGVKFRYRHPDQMCTLIILEDDLVQLDYPQGVESITVGQIAVFYDGDRMLGGGFIGSIHSKAH